MHERYSSLCIISMHRVQMRGINDDQDPQPVRDLGDIGDVGARILCWPEAHQTTRIGHPG
jgi:hypothetical protein